MLRVLRKFLLVPEFLFPRSLGFTASAAAELRISRVFVDCVLIFSELSFFCLLQPIGPFAFRFSKLDKEGIILKIDEEVCIFLFG